MDLGLTDRTYLVTGATRGLGFATARELVADGANVVLTGRTEESAAAAAASLGERALGVAADNADPEGPRRLVAAARERFGRLDGVLISVGGPPPGGALDNTDDQWQQAFESVFLGAVRLARTAAAELAEGGVIGFVLSGSVHEPIPGLTVSNGLRPGLAGFAKSLSVELGPRGIRVLGVLPGRIATDRMTQLDALSGDPEGTRARNSAAIPLGRYGTPEEFGRAAAFLLSPAASYVTGVMVPVDGGARHGF
ncbi:3-oxoacyl-[acyl-carrier protein] reductase [Streptomyces sp. 2224.1]|uniref:SDR family oxidoreductase n=1 Tax=unclassified Streptomyces TaxID=2593676 RepID=UPI0008908302|nr:MULTISPECIES: SDR family oxidoreductase [unclassified Streptomyces]PBC81686.1 3-oxoacyl-[acyl-carrier protein] reductase [Streptomyces sp. 2321.6]SDR53624.1 3-oxoacyl-[acyl-carrier protein] reductase [Streptomyces sp. KS_16]SEC26156.1 3-oxoacyl-[acyl-carrier protein] reductase [Streptomyces sp. 2133.1]SED08077.1 3-oxoacyl-[acyl-carrier protein] reductase [Streptomyces sp. 2224.1]SEF05897.1 3-oxoacyl-[acyl-carrier protein] reductase [Streptomyces sp. 2112.3]